MQSPKFPFRQSELRPLFTAGTIRRIWTDKVRKGMRRHHLPDPIDHLDFQLNLAAECAVLEASIFTGAYAPGDTRRILVEKSKGLCRQIVIPTVRDAIVLQCLSDALYRDIRGKEPTNQAFFEPEDHSFSNKDKIFKVSEYGSFKAWLNFQKELLKFANNKNYVVVTDIANYYDTVSYSHLRNIISDLDIGVRESVLDMLIFVLSGLLWQPDYMPRVEMGLPQINTDAPRILAHCFLYELDKFLDSKCGTDFARYMDDLDIGVDTVLEAKQILKCVDLVLHTRQVRLNSGKTLILTQTEAAWHYRARDNAFMSKIEALVERKVAKGVTLDRERRLLRKWLPAAYRAGRFSGGNGEKIIKRALKIAVRIGADVGDKFLFELALRSPGLREPVLRLFAQLPASPRRISALHQLVVGGNLVDDASFVMIANALVEMQIPKVPIYENRIGRLIADFPEETLFQKYAKLWVASKYARDSALLDLVSRFRSTWKTDDWLGRLIGGLYPRFINSPVEAAFRTLVKDSGAPAAVAVYDFHDDVRRDVTVFGKVQGFAKAGNPSKRVGTSHARYLISVSAISNGAADAKKISAITKGLGRAWGDAFYLATAQRASGLTMPSAPSGPFPFA